MDSGESTSTLRFEEIFRTGSDAEHSYPLPFDDRSGRVTVFSSGDLVLADTRMNADKLTAPWEHVNHQPFVELNFMLAGNLYQSHSGLLNRHLYTQGYHNWLFNPYSLEKNELVGTGYYRHIGLNVRPAKMVTLLSTYVPELQYVAEKIAQGVAFVFQAPVDALPNRLRYLFDCLWDSPEPVGLKRLYFESIALELICQQCETLLDTSRRPHLRSINPDHDKLLMARSILQQRLSNPPSLSELARLCQLNEFGLKRGFRKVFSTSVFGFVQAERLETARHLIYGGGKTISEIAYELGYAHPQHFHRAFKKQFGVTPKQLVS